MINYKTRPGVVLTEVCGQYLLVSAKEAREYCPYVNQINETSAFIWKTLQHGAGIDTVKQAVMNEYEAEESELDGVLEMFIRELYEKGYLIQEGEE